MKSQIFRNLKKLVLVNGLALLFVLITFSSTLATATPHQGSQPVADLDRSSLPQTGRPAAAASSAALDAPGEKRTSPIDQTVPRANSASGFSSNIATAGSSTLISDTLSQDWGDFDRDGYLDLALGTYNGVTIYHNNGGQLAFSQTITSGAIYGLRWADLDNDGLLELVTVRNTPGMNGIYRFTGTGFISYTAFASTLPLARVVVISSTTRDLIVSTSAISVPCTVLRFTNAKNSGYFATTTPTCVSTAPTAGIDAGDFNNDGYTDLVVGRFPNEVSLLISSNTGVLTEATTTQKNSFMFDQAASWPYDFAWGDYDGDGHLDVAATFPLQRQVRIYHNEWPNTNPPFKLSGILPAQRFMAPLSIDWGDFNGDGMVDLAVADDPPRVYFNVNKSIKVQSNPLIPNNQPTDEVMWDTRAVALDNNNLSVALNGKLDPTRLYDTIRGHLQPEILPLGVNIAANSIAWGDATGDGRSDLLVGTLTGTTPSVLYRNVSGTITTTGASMLVSGQYQHVAFGNFDKRNKQLGFVIGDTYNTTIGRLNIYKYLGANPSTWILNEPVGAVALGDFNDDGWLDLLVGTQSQNGNGTILLYRNGQGTLLSSPAFITTVVGQVRGVAWADSDAPTGYLDFAVVTSNRVYVFHNNQNNTFAVSSVEDVNGYTAVAWGDFDGESGPELATGSNGQGVRIYGYRNESLTLLWPAPYLSQTTSLASGDWDNDGRIDLAVGNDGEPAVVYANFNSTPGSVDLRPIWSSQDRRGTTAVAWGDVNNDGYLDLAVSRRDGANGVYYNTSATPWRLPTPPTYLSIARPGKAFDAYLYSSSDFLPGYVGITTPTLAPTTTISYTVFNPAGTPITNTQLEFSVDGGTTWQTASYIGTAVPTQTSAAGRAGALIWDARQDQAFSDNALLRVRVVDQAPLGPFQRAADVAVSPPFRVRAMSCQWLAGLWIAVQPGNIVQPNERVTFDVETSEHPWGTISYTWIIEDGPNQKVIAGGFSQIPYRYEYKGRFRVLVRATSEQCSEGPVLEAVTYMQVGTISQTYPLYLPLIQRSSTTARSGATGGAAVNNHPRQAAASIGGKTSCMTQTISPSSWPTVAWLTGTTGYYGQPVVNLDGSRFAFWSTADLAGTNSDGSMELYYAQVDRLASCITFRQVTSSTGSILEGFALGPAINADGSRVAFFSDQNLANNNHDRNFEVFLANINSIDDMSLTQVTSSTRSVNALPTINADGDRIAFVSDQDFGNNSDRNQEIFVAAITSLSGQVVCTQVTQTALGTFNDEPSLSSDGQQVAFVRGSQQLSGIQEIFLGNAVQSGALITVTASPNNVLNYHPTIGGSGSQYSVAYAATDLTQEVVNFATVSGSSVNITPVYTTPRNSSAALNVSDGSRVVVVSGTQHINVLVAGSQGIKPIHSCAGANCPSVAISGDGMHVVFTTKQGLREAYYETATLSFLLSQPMVPVVAGTKLTRTITLANNGPSFADGVDFSSTLRADHVLPVTFTTSPSGICLGDETVRCRLPGLAANSFAYITLTTNQEIDAGRLAPITLTLNAHAWQANQTATNPSLTVAAAADLKIGKSVATTGVAGELVTYTLTITNDGPSHARNVLLSDRLPGDLISSTLSWVSGPTFTLTNTAGTITGTLDLLRKNEPATIRVVAELGSTAFVGKLISNTGIITSSTSELASGNNHSQADFAVTTRSEPTVTKSALGIVLAGSPLTYTIIVTNNGPSATSHLVLTDVLPAQLTIVTDTVPNGCSSLADRTLLTCNLTDLDKAGSHTITFTAETDSEIEENTQLINTVLVSATNAVKTVSNTATTQTGVGSLVRITKTATLSVTAGNSLIYTITVGNHGPSLARYVTMTDHLPTEYISYTKLLSQATYSPYIPPQCNYVMGTITCTMSLINNGQKIFMIHATSHQTLPVNTAITNTARAISGTSPIAVVDTATTVISDSISQLTAAKSADATVLAGNSVHYTVVVTNSGPSYAPYVTVTDQLPTGVVFTSTGSSSSCGSADQSSVTCTLRDLLVGATQRQTVTIAGIVSYTLASGSALNNTAEITASNAVTSVNVSATTTVRTSSQLAIDKTATEFVTTVTTPTASSEIVTYTIVITNLGPSLARNVVLTDVLPVSVTYLSQVSANPLITPTVLGRTITWSIGTITPNTTSAITFRGEVLTTTAGPVTLTNAAYVTATTAPALVTATASTYVWPSARLALTKTLLTPQPVTAQSPITYRIVVQNLGPSVVPSIFITDILPVDVFSGPDAIAWEGAACNHENGSLIVTCIVTPDLSAGASRVITISANTKPNFTNQPTFTNTVYATSAIATVMVSDTEVGTTVAQASLRITKTLSPLNAVAVAGGVLAYTVTVGNEGPSNIVHTVTLTDTLPAELLNVQSSSDCNRVGRIVTCTVGSLDFGSAWSITVTGRLSDSLPAGWIITNTAQATTTIASTVATDSLTSTVGVLADLSINKLAPATAGAGELLTYTIIVTNNGPSLAPSVRITDMLPISVTYLTQSGSEPPLSPPTSTGRLLTWPLSSLVPGARQIITFNVRLTNTVGVSVRITNTAYVTSTSATAVISSPVGTQVRDKANLILTKTLLTANPIAGEDVTYAITVTNLGPSSVPTGAAIITDQLPAELIYSSSNLALNKPTTGSAWDSSPCNSNQIPTKAVDGKWSVLDDRWCSDISGTKSLTVDLGANMTVNQFILRHADVCGSFDEYNTRGFNIQASPDGQNFTQVVTVTDNSDDITTHNIDTVVARYVRLDVITGTQPSAGDSAARICEFEVYDNSQSNALVAFTNDSPLGIYASWGVTISGRILPSAIAPFTNTAYATATIATAMVSDSAVTTPTIQVNLRVNKSAASTAYAGNPLTYTIFITNDGPSLAPSITLTDYLSSSLTIGPVPSECGAVGNVVTCTLVNMDIGAAHSRSIVLTPTVNSNVVSGTPIINTAVVTGSHTVSSMTSSVTTTVQQSAAVTVTKLADSSVIAGNPLTYTSYITNNGPSVATLVTVTDQLSADFVSVVAPSVTAPDTCTVNGNLIQCTFPNMGVGPANRKLLVLTPTLGSSVVSGTSILNTALLTSSYPLNSESSAVASTVQTAANLAISTHITPTNVPSTTISAVKVTINFANGGPSDAKSVYITETLGVLTHTTAITKPVYVTGPTGSNCGSGSEPHQCFWFISILTKSLVGTIEFTATAPSATGSQVIEASIGSSTSDPDTSDNTRSDTLIFVQVLPRLYWAGLSPIRWPVALLGARPRDFWSLSP